MVKIITDSTCDFSAEAAASIGLTMVPLKVNIDGKQYVEGVDITGPQFYELLGKAKKLPTTSQPSPEEFLVHFEKVKEAGDSAVVFTISSALSGTFQSANIAKEMCGYDDIYIIDTLSATIGIQLFINRAVQMRESGSTAKEIADYMQPFAQKVTILAIVDTLEYLHKGGRLSRSKSVIGTLLNVKPIIDVSRGNIEVPATNRGAEKSVASLLKLYSGAGVDEDWPVIWGYTGSLPLIETYKKHLPQNYQNDFGDNGIGAVIGTHIGPGAMAIAFMRK